jgi:aspartyl/glutamyl-tRNA(Asn/Gln) amidotransferase C subunit
MKVDEKTVKKIASLARIEVKQDELAGLQKDLSNIFGFIDSLVDNR